MVDGVVTKVETPSGGIPLADVAGVPLTVDAMRDAAIVAADRAVRWPARWPGTIGVPSELLIDPDPTRSTTSSTWG